MILQLSRESQRHTLAVDIHVGAAVGAQIAAARREYRRIGSRRCSGCISSIHGPGPRQEICPAVDLGYDSGGSLNQALGLCLESSTY